MKIIRELSECLLKAGRLSLEAYAQVKAGILGEEPGEDLQALLDLRLGILPDVKKIARHAFNGCKAVVRV